MRTHAGMFDVSHMGEVEVEGPGALAFLQRVLSNDVAAIEIGGAQYSCLCNEDGGVLDDLFAYRLGGDRYLLVTNSANHEADLAWLGRWSRDYDVAVRDVADRYAMLAVQGPHARAIVAATLGDRAAAADAGRRGPRRRPPGARLRHRLHRRGRGRAADRPRDRAGDLGRAARRRRRPLRPRRPRHPAARGLLPPARQRPHPGAQPDRSRPRLVLRGGDRASSAPRRSPGARAEGPAEKLAPFKIEGAGIPRQGNPVLAGGEEVGVVTSRHLLALARDRDRDGLRAPDLAEPGTEVEIDVRGKRRPARIASKPLYDGKED